jgi:hypothetical protein
MKLRAFLYAIIIAALPAFAAECMTLETVRRDAAAFRPPFIITELGKEETEAFLQAYNALPPRTNQRGDYSVVFSRDESINVVYMYFRENCVIETLFMKRDFFEELRGTALPKLEGQKA